MLKCLITPGSYATADTNIPITLYKNTNDIYSLNEDDNTVSVKAAGLTEVKANIIITSSSTSTISAQLLANDEIVEGALYDITPANSSTYTLTINDIVPIVNQVSDEYVNLAIQLSTACSIVGGDMIFVHHN